MSVIKTLICHREIEIGFTAFSFEKIKMINDCHKNATKMKFISRIFKNIVKRGENDDNSPHSAALFSVYNTIQTFDSFPNNKFYNFSN